MLSHPGTPRAVSSLQKNLPHPLMFTPIAPFPLVPVNKWSPFCPSGFPIVDISCKWNHSTCGLLCLASFSRHVSKVHPWGSLCQSFIPCKLTEVKLNYLLKLLGLKNFRSPSIPYGSPCTPPWRVCTQWADHTPYPLPPWLRHRANAFTNSVLISVWFSDIGSENMSFWIRK